jgi:hypothetical protein
MREKRDAALPVAVDILERFVDCSSAIVGVSSH